MSKVDSIKNILLQSDNGLCIAIRGTWGIGKTYLWKQIQEDIEKSTKQRVVYISLFGKEHYSQVLEEIVLQLFRNHNEIAKKASKLISKTINIISSGQITIEAESLFSVLQKKDFNNIIVCFDDIERKSDELKMKYFMGLISQLKDLRDCKVVVILNDEKLQNNKQSMPNENSPKKTTNNEDSDCSDYALYKDKCIDYEFRIESALEVAKHIIENMGFLKDKDKNFLEELILDIFKKYFDNNLRLLLRAIENMQYFYEHCNFNELENKYEKKLFRQAMKIFYEDVLLIEKEISFNRIPYLEYFKNNRRLEDGHKKSISAFLDINLLSSNGYNLSKILREYVYSSMSDESFIQAVRKIEGHVDEIKNFTTENIDIGLAFINFDTYDKIFKYYKDIKEEKSKIENKIREQYIDFYVKAEILKGIGEALDIKQIIGDDSKLQKYYTIKEQETIGWIENNRSNIDHYNYLNLDNIEYYNYLNIDDIVTKFKDKEFYEKFFHHYTIVNTDEILLENNLFKAYKKFLEQNKIKKQAIMEFLENNKQAKLRDLFFMNENGL